jgi:hypothetical protein
MRDADNSDFAIDFDPLVLLGVAVVCWVHGSPGWMRPR